MYYLKYDLDEYVEEPSSLIAIHTVVEDFRLAYHINKCCDIQFKRNHNLYVPQLKTTVRGLIWENEWKEEVWYLLSNKLNSKEELNLQLTIKTLFEKKKYNDQFLLPEFKLVDYFIKTPKNSMSEKSIKRIQNLPEVEMVYVIPDTLIKSSQNLIFD